MVEAAFTNRDPIPIYDVIFTISVLREPGVRKWQACTNRSIRGTVVMKAIESKQPAMFKEVVNCVRECIPDQQVIQ